MCEARAVEQARAEGWVCVSCDGRLGVGVGVGVGGGVGWGAELGSAPRVVGQQSVLLSPAVVRCEERN